MLRNSFVPRGLCRFGFALFFTVLSAAAQTTIHIPQDQPTIQAGIDAANNGDTVLVSAGTYVVNLKFEGKAITVTSGATSADSALTKATILTLGSEAIEGAVRFVSFVNNEGPGSVFNGFTLQAPATPVPDEDADIDGPFSSPTITNNRFIGGTGAAAFGGGEFAGNYVTGMIGYVLSAGSNIHDNVFENNSNTNAAGNVVSSALFEVDGLFQRNIVRNNIETGAIVVGESSTMGSLFSVPGDTPTEFLQNVIEGNQAPALVQVLSVEQLGVQTIVAENTFANNTVSPSCTSLCSQILLSKSGTQYGNSVMIANNIFSTTSPAPFIACDDYGGSFPPPAQDTLQVDHNLFPVSTGPIFDSSCRQQITMSGNISGDPQFVNAAAGDFHLTAGSPAIDAGNNSLIGLLALVDIPLTTDFDGTPRPVDATGRGYPILDMGAFEFPGVVDGSPTSLLLVPPSYAPNVSQGSTFTAVLTSALGAPQGSVTLYEDGVKVGSATIQSDEAAVFSVPPSATGVHEFVATYGGLGSFAPATSLKLVVYIALTPTTLQLTATPAIAQAGSTVTISVAVTASDGSIPTPVTLTDNGNPLATLLPDAAGQATLAVNNLALGANTLVATYAGTFYYASATATTTVSIVQNDFAIALNPPSVTVTAGRQGQVNVLLSSLGLFAGALNLSASQLPMYASVSFGAAKVSLAAGGTASSVLSIHTADVPNGGVASERQNGRPGGMSLAVAFAALVVVPFAMRRRRLPIFFTALVAFALLGGSTGCTTVSVPINKVAPGTYVIPVTATDPGTQTTHTANLTFVVIA